MESGALDGLVMVLKMAKTERISNDQKHFLFRFWIFSIFIKSSEMIIAIRFNPRRPTRINGLLRFVGVYAVHKSTVIVLLLRWMIKNLSG